MRTRVVLLLLLLSLLYVQPIKAQTTDVDEEEKKGLMVEKVKAWDQEINLDSLDQEELPKTVTGGLLFAANLSNFIIRNGENKCSYMNVGMDFGGFVDFSVTKHFAIQPRLIFTAEENHVQGVPSKDQVWSVGMDIPVFFMGRFGNNKTGYLQFGAGPFTHFSIASNINAYNSEAQFQPLPQDTAFVDFYRLHDNHFGLAATLGYEFGMGLQIVFNYQISLSDIATFYRKQEEQGVKVTDASVYPQKVSLGITYRWK